MCVWGGRRERRGGEKVCVCVRREGVGRRCVCGWEWEWGWGRGEGEGGILPDDVGCDIFQGVAKEDHANTAPSQVVVTETMRANPRAGTYLFLQGAWIRP